MPDFAVALWRDFLARLARSLAPHALSLSSLSTDRQLSPILSPRSLSLPTAVGMLAVALVSVSSLLVPAPARSLGRRELLLPLPLVLLAPANSAASAREPAAEPLISDGMRVLLTKAKALRGYVANTAAARRSFPMDPDPEVNNYLKLKDAVERAQATVLLPLLAALERKAGAAQLPEEQQKQLAQQPLLLKGHLPSWSRRWPWRRASRPTSPRVRASSTEAAKWSGSSRRSARRATSSSPSPWPEAGVGRHDHSPL